MHPPHPTNHHRDPSAHLPASLLLHVNNEAVAPLPVLVAYHKPLGVHSTVGDPMGRPNLEDALPPRLAKAFHPVGRLDADTTGLLLFSGDGQLTQRLLHPSSNVQRQYLATVEGACLWVHCICIALCSNYAINQSH